jgi:hypothetical protein
MLSNTFFFESEDFFSEREIDISFLKKRLLLFAIRFVDFKKSRSFIEKLLDIKLSIKLAHYNYFFLLCPYLFFD